MAKIPPYVAGNARIGQKLEVKVRKLVWLRVGQGIVKTFTDYEVLIAGRLNFMGYDGDLTIDLRLLDEDPAASSGPCYLRLNKHEDQLAKYRDSRDTLTVFAVLGGKKQNIAIRRTNGGRQTECELSGHIDQTVHLEPS